ncbi:hypothetical protein BDK51DRAFT_45681 [Blyttiomyces helicus]|uniref:Uncharacterized protein n=1 Tax=Blyttiomyces helicus TaxID=388810 RepID=A0A4P9WHX8_9FUNG|nr:hypothetical protein BDK51DRAFT_45681 [Blyttiomyces helicus]|eukprot:RKO92002.1 hypothetical protein BDK51DRAFT_45681 [Blyttiomyces helicus]
MAASGDDPNPSPNLERALQKGKGAGNYLALVSLNLDRVGLVRPRYDANLQSLPQRKLGQGREEKVIATYRPKVLDLLGGGSRMGWESVIIQHANHPEDSPHTGSDKPAFRRSEGSRERKSCAPFPSAAATKSRPLAVETDCTLRQSSRLMGHPQMLRVANSNCWAARPRIPGCIPHSIKRLLLSKASDGVTQLFCAFGYHPCRMNLKRLPISSKTFKSTPEGVMLAAGPRKLMPLAGNGLGESGKEEAENEQMRKLEKTPLSTTSSSAPKTTLSDPTQTTLQTKQAQPAAQAAEQTLALHSLLPTWTTLRKKHARHRIRHPPSTDEDFCQTISTLDQHQTHVPPTNTSDTERCFDTTNRFRRDQLLREPECGRGDDGDCGWKDGDLRATGLVAANAEIVGDQRCLESADERQRSAGLARDCEDVNKRAITLNVQVSIGFDGLSCLTRVRLHHDLLSRVCVAPGFAGLAASGPGNRPPNAAAPPTPTSPHAGGARGGRGRGLRRSLRIGQASGKNGGARFFSEGAERPRRVDDVVQEPMKLLVLGPVGPSAEQQFPDRDAHTVNAKVAKPEDAAAVQEGEGR